MVPSGKTGKSQLAASLAKKSACTWFSFVLQLRNQRPLFIACGQRASSPHHGMIKWSASPSLRGFAFHFQLVQSSLTLKIVTFHLCSENFTTGDRLGEVFVGEALNLVEHLEHSQGHLPCITTAADRPDSQSGTRHRQLWRVFCTCYTLWDGKGWWCVIKNYSVSIWTHTKSPLSSGFLPVWRSRERGPLGRIHLKAHFPHPGEPAPLDRLQWQIGGDSKSFWKGERLLFPFAIGLGQSLCSLCIISLYPSLCRGALTC